jgi:hypothetical protein
MNIAHISVSYGFINTGNDCVKRKSEGGAAVRWGDNDSGHISAKQESSAARSGTNYCRLYQLKKVILSYSLIIE